MKTRIFGLLAWIAYWGALFVFFGSSRKLLSFPLGTNGWLLLLELLIILGTITSVPVALILSILKRNWRFLYASANLILTILTFLLALEFFPEDRLLAMFRGAPTISASYKGTQNQAVLTFRQKGNMDIFWSGWPGTGHWTTGRYEQAGSQIICKFDGSPPRNFTGAATIANGAVIFDTNDEYQTFRFETARK